MNSVEKIYNKYPKVKEKIKDPNDPQVILTNQEAVFYQLVQFFNQPDTFQFSLNLVYNHLKNDDLLFAVESIIAFFQKDTQLAKDVNQSYYDNHLSNEKIVGQKGFATMVEEGIPGIKFKPSMVHTYWKRQTGRVPNADLIIDSTPYWKEKTVESFIEKEKIRREKKLQRKDKE